MKPLGQDDLGSCDHKHEINDLEGCGLLASGITGLRIQTRTLLSYARLPVVVVSPFEEVVGNYGGNLPGLCSPGNALLWGEERRRLQVRWRERIE